MEQLSGLTQNQATSQPSAGLSNKPTDSASPSYPVIIFRNVFNLINTFLLPLLIILLLLGKYKDAFTIGGFALVNSIVSMWDEVRIKRRLERIQLQFGKKARVIRDHKEQELFLDELVINDLVKVVEGEGIPTDGEIVFADHLLIDESLITGESDYINKKEGEHVIGGSFVITGVCVFRIAASGKSNYVHQLSSQSRAYRKEKSNLQKIGDKLTIYFVVGATIAGAITYFSARAQGYPINDAIIPLVSAVGLIVPQTLIFLFTFTFTISVFQLSRKGVLVQRGSAIESLANLDVLCFDKTGTITSNTMKVVEGKYWNVRPENLGGYINFSADKVFGKNKTFAALVEFFAKYPSVNAFNFMQIPFTSRSKVTKNQFQLEHNKEYVRVFYGATNIIIDFVDPALRNDVLDYVSSNESLGRRVLLGVVKTSDTIADLETPFSTDHVWVITLQEELNPGLKDILQQFKTLGTELKIISGDSYKSVERILSHLDIDMSRAIDLSKFSGNLSDAAAQYDIFTRSKPEDKLVIVKALQAQGKLVGMVGDGVNDVLALKLSNLSIAMESGAKIARDVADVVLLNNDFSLVPQVLFEAENIIANLIYMNKLFMSKAVQAIIFIIICAVFGLYFPFLPTAIWIYGFLGSSLPSYVVAFWRRHVATRDHFYRQVLPFAIVSGAVSAVVSLLVYLQVKGESTVYISTVLIYTNLLLSSTFAMHQLWNSGYVRKLYQVVLAWLLINIGSLVPLFIPLLNTIYDITPLRVDIVKIMLPLCFAGAVVYLLLYRISVQITK